MKLDVGCGNHCLSGAVGIDHKPYPNVQIVHNLNAEPWPIEAKSCEFIRCQHVIEHIENLECLAREFARVAKPGCTAQFITPHYSSYASWGDPTHRHHFARGSIPQLFEMTIGTDRFEVTKNEIRFTGSALDFFGWLIYKLSPKTYEKHFAWIFPANEIHTDIRFK